MAMASRVLWISAQVLAFACLLVPGSRYQVLLEGEKCGAWISGACESGLICRSSPDLSEPSHEFYAEGVCTRDPACNCSEFQCPPGRRDGCRTRRVLDPCGCCSHCARKRGQVCGGPSWKYGYCDSDLVCALVVGLDSIRPPQTGVCKELPKHLKRTFSQPPCPVQYGCNVHVGNCDCYSGEGCENLFTYHNYEACHTVLMEFLMYDPFETEVKKPPKPDKPEPVCMEWGCEVQGCQCVCQKRRCDYMVSPLYEAACCNMLKESGCHNASCPEIPTPSCPADSVLSEPYTADGQCCPEVPAMCTCNFQTCAPKPAYCPLGALPKVVEKGTGHPGTCCDRYECVKEGD